MISWEWKDNIGWKVFDTETSNLLEEAFLLGQPSVKLTHGFFAKDGYTVKLVPHNQMRQVCGRLTDVFIGDTPLDQQPDKF